MDRMTKAAARLTATIALVSVMLSSPSAMAGLYVQEAVNAQGLPVKQELAEDHKFDLPEGAQVRLLQTPSGKTFVMRGPFKGTLKAFVDSCNGWLAFTYPYCGGSGDQLPVGGTRGVQK